MKSISNALTEKGNLKSAVQKAIKEQSAQYLEQCGFTRMPNGKFAMVLADAAGKVVTMNLEMSVGLDTNFAAKEVKVAPVKLSDPIEVPVLF